MNKILRFSLLSMISFMFLSLQAQGPNNSGEYYKDADGKTGKALKTALFAIINDHKDLGYDALWRAFESTDRRPDGKVWDMYSNITNYSFGDRGSFRKEGDAFNREHSFPKSWFGKARPMHNDLFHLYPTDGYINGMRSNYAFGEVDYPQKTSANGFSKLGPASKRINYPGSNPVFEPNDEYKGDFARTYFYMVTCYENKVQGWSGNYMLSHDRYPALAPWALEMLMRWSKEDPVSEKEIKRNEAVYKLQKNRNPFIDYPGLEEYVWGSKKDQPFVYDQYGGQSADRLPMPQIVSEEGADANLRTIVLKCSAQDATIYFTLDGSVPTERSEVYRAPFELSATTTVNALAVKDGKKSAVATLLVTIGESSSGEDAHEPASELFAKVTKESQLNASNQYILVCESSSKSAGSLNRYVLDVVDINFDDEHRVEARKDMFIFSLEREEGSNAYGVRSGDGYLIETKQKRLGMKSAKDLSWYVRYSDGGYSLFTEKSVLQYNAGAPRFTTYSGTQTPAFLYFRSPSGTSGIEHVEADVRPRSRGWYTITGVRIASPTVSGLYIHDGKKVYIHR